MRKLLKHGVWLGVLLNIVGFVSYFTHMAYVPMLRDSAWLNLLLCAVGIGLATWGALGLRRWYRFVGAGLAVVVAGLLAVYVFWFSAQIPSPAQALDIGSKLPKIELVDSAGAQTRLEIPDGRTLVLVFYRGFW